MFNDKFNEMLEKGIVSEELRPKLLYVFFHKSNFGMLDIKNIEDMQAKTLWTKEDASDN